MKLSIFGLGYVGVVSAGCLANEGHVVTGVDPNRGKVDLINQGLSPIVEKDVGAMIATAVSNGRLRATTSGREAVAESELSLICVGTPSQLNGNLDLSHVRNVCEDIGSALRAKSGFHTVAMRSTILPGSMRSVVIPTLEKWSNRKEGYDFSVCINPEFLREGSAVSDYHHPPKIVIGESDSRAGDVLAKLYEALDAPLIRTDFETAEMVKYVDNAWHALKVSFANEIGSLSKVLGIDGHQLMGIFCRDTKLNLSPSYLAPGFAFGGSCLPKDVRALSFKARSLDVELPVIQAILPSNRLHIERGGRMVAEKGGRRIGILGFSFKAGTDDLRESPIVALIEHLVGKGYELKIYDRNVQLAALTGANRDYILNHIPHISKLMVGTIAEVLDFADTVVIGNKTEEFLSVPDNLKPEQSLVDFVRIIELRSSGQYDGICW
jgi:GDP-mannose 6-dehydrogenase